MCVFETPDPLKTTPGATQRSQFSQTNMRRTGASALRQFYIAFDEFDNQCIEDSLESEDLLVRIFAVLDRRVGKRRLVRLYEACSDDDEIFRMMLGIRMRAEGIDTKE